MNKYSVEAINYNSEVYSNEWFYGLTDNEALDKAEEYYSKKYSETHEHCIIN